MTAKKTSSAALPLDHDELLACYRRMRTIRDFEERLHVDFSRGDIPGFVHLYAGEEAARDAGIVMAFDSTQSVRESPATRYRTPRLRVGPSMTGGALVAILEHAQAGTLMRAGSPGPFANRRWGSALAHRLHHRRA